MTLDIDTIMSEHGLSREEATEVMRQLKGEPSTPAPWLGHSFCIFLLSFLVAIFEILVDCVFFAWKPNPGLSQATPRPKAAAAKARVVDFVY